MTESRRSVTFTVLIFFGMAIAIVGLVMMIAGLGGSTTFDLTIGEWKLKTTSSGLAVLAVGAGLSAGVALNLPEGVQVMGPSKPTPASQLRKLALPAAGVGVLSIIGFVYSLIA